MNDSVKETVKSETSSAPADLAAQHSTELSLTKFAKVLPSLLPGELHTKITFAEAGIFVTQDHVPDLVAAYKKWYSAVTQREHELSDEKATKRVFGEHELELNYLINGKSCILGYLAPCKGVNQIRCSIPSCLGSIQSTATTLHYRDPIWSQIDGLALTVSDAGIKSTLTFNGIVLTLATEALDKFGVIYSRARWMHRLSASPVHDRREGLRVLVKLLRRARPRGRKFSVLIPSKYLKKSVELIGVASIVFVVESRGAGLAELIDCYDLRPPAFGDLVDREIKELSRVLPHPRHGCMELRTDPKGRTSISFHAQQEHFEIDPHGLGSVLSVCQNDPRSMPKLFTTFELLRAISRVFERSIWVQPDRVPKALSTLAARYPRIRSTSGWLFFIDRSNTIRIFARDGRAEGPPLLTAEREQAPRSQRSGRQRQGQAKGQGQRPGQGRRHGGQRRPPSNRNSRPPK